MMNFRRIELAIEVCRNHLDSTNARNSEIESYLVSHIIVLVIAEYEMLLEKMILKRVGRTNDAHVQSFVHKSLDKFFRSIKVTEISGLLGRFGEDYKKSFQDAAANIQPAISRYGNILQSRHAIAHEASLNMTWAELEISFNESKLVLSAIANALGLTADEIKDF